MQQVIANRYTLQEIIGQGGNGIVYKAHDRVSQKMVAIKQLRPEQIDTSPNVLERFRREGEALRDLNHPNIVTMVDMIEEDDNQYLIQEYFPSGDLAKIIRADLMPIDRIVEIALGLADALTRAHHLNIIHRDLKPANVLMSDDGVPHLTDFGVALMGHKKRMTEKGTPVGTIEYLSPEALTAEVDNRSDIWSFGIMLFEMLTQARPFKGNTLSEVVGAILTAPVPDLEILRPECPLALIDLIYRMLEKDRSDRISSVRVIGAELEAILRGTAPTVREVAVPSVGLMSSRFAQDMIQDATHHNLPITSQLFVGRDYEIDDVLRLIDDPATRLITLLGIGGVGKTRLALEVGFRALQRFDNRVFFVDLAPIRDASLVPASIAEAMHFKFLQDGRSHSQQLVDYLAPKRLLLIVDNLEHVMAGNQVIGDIVEQCAQIVVLVTSRQRLNLSDESVIHLRGMDFPEDSIYEHAIEYSAVRLFLQYARRIRPDFVLAHDDVAHVSRLCKLVEGLPLGIILAASWVGMLSIAEIAQEIDENADFLSTDMADLPVRHRSMRAVFDYSWRLLSDAEKAIFMKLAVFRGGFSRDAAIAIVGANLRMMMTLMNKSLLHRDADSNRYTVHDLLRAYAKEKLESSTLGKDVRNAHMTYYCDLAYREATQLFGGAQLQAVEVLDVEIDNIRSAWHWAIETHAEDQLARLSPMWIYFDNLGLWQEAIDLAEDSIVALDATQSVTVGDLLTMAGICAYRSGQFHAANDYDDRALAIFTALDLEAKLILPRLNHINVQLVTVDIHEMSEDAIREYEALIELSNEHGLYWEEATCLLNLGFLYLELGELDLAEQATRAAIESGRAANDLILSGVATHNLGDIMYRRGEAQFAKDVLTESFSIALMFNNVLLIYINLIFLSKASVAMKDYQAAYDYAQRAAITAAENGLQLHLHDAMIALTAMLLRQSSSARSALLVLLDTVLETPELVTALPELLIGLPFYLAAHGRHAEASQWAATLLAIGLPEQPMQTQLENLYRTLDAGIPIEDIASTLHSVRGILSQ